MTDTSPQSLDSVSASEAGKETAAALTVGQRRARIALVAAAFVLFSVFISGMAWLFTGNTQNAPWFLFAYVTGLSMIVLPCTLPLAFVIVPLAMRKGYGAGIAVALSFGLGVSITLSMYGALVAWLGQIVGLDNAKNVMYTIAGAAALIFGLGQLGLIKIKIPAYSGKLPDFIQKQKDLLKAFFLGLFLGNVGFGCPNPAFYVLLGYIATVGDVGQGWLLTFVHAIGRITPLIFLSILAILGVNALPGLVSRKGSIERVMGWALSFVGAFIVTFGLFGHDWYVFSGIHSWLELLTQEGPLTQALSVKFRQGLEHAHGIPPGPALPYGQAMFLILLVVPIVWHYVKKRHALKALSGDEAIQETVVMRWRFWASVLSIAIILGVFGYYLPHRLRDEALRPDDHGQELMTAGEHPALHSGGEADDIVVEFSTSSNPTAGKPTRLTFSPFTKPNRVPIRELALVHEASMHVFGIRSDSRGFFHIHPEATAPGSWGISHVFTEPGAYTIWVELEFVGVEHIFTYAVEVGGAGEQEVALPALNREVTVAGSSVEFEAAADLYAGEDSDFAVDVHRPDGTEQTLEDYLGEVMHLVVISDDHSVFGHVHPVGHAGGHGGGTDAMMEDMHGTFLGVPVALAHGDEAPTAERPAMGGEMHGVLFRYQFPKAGAYTVFAQFRPQDFGRPAGEALTAAFRVEVRPAEGLRPGVVFDSWWGRLVLSLLFIVGLSWVVRRYVNRV
ncbi:hypothetical protein HYW67_02800 [Candidatus Parcubacteria bacterium]|nr:hypothetical protein [Candidatus Parcubacteria bacterium]